jgi:hypothetical protein
VRKHQVRFRRARGVERLQLTWLVWAVALFAVLNSQRWITGNGPIPLLLTLPLVPAAAAVAILRYDLYDIRVIVNRTLVYGLLTALLGLSYAGAVLVLGQLAGRDRNNLAVAGATLAVATLVQPARRCLICLIIRLIIQTIRQVPTGSVWIDEAPNVSVSVHQASPDSISDDWLDSTLDPSRANSTQGHCVDADHQVADLVVG